MEDPCKTKRLRNFREIWERMSLRDFEDSFNRSEVLGYLLGLKQHSLGVK